MTPIVATPFRADAGEIVGEGRKREGEGWCTEGRVVTLLGMFFFSIADGGFVVVVVAVVMVAVILPLGHCPILYN